ncbi:TetR family transcriptional regulator [Blastococcus sp. URHD0036]|uniref:TetR family transcriptional regulator n=1 Tax=Blastococcus sp. URHD0036 TaxID=1380356 RepID=UPI0004955F15|nr:TetR family transcriptional regulator [Blastococcus sp. URHD0036]
MTSGLRERKKLATRFALHQAALQLVAERGLDGVSVDDIAARADVSPRTFFNYFPAKDDAVLGFDTTSTPDLAERFAARPAGESTLAALRAVQVEQATEIAAEPEGLWPLRLTVIEAEPVLIARLHAVFGAAERDLAAAIATRTGTDAGVDAHPALLAGVSGVAMRTALHRWLATDFTRSLPDLVGEAWDALAAGLSDPRA